MGEKLDVDLLGVDLVLGNLVLVAQRLSTAIKSLFSVAASVPEIKTPVGDFSRWCPGRERLLHSFQHDP